MQLSFIFIFIILVFLIFILLINVFLINLILYCLLDSNDYYLCSYRFESKCLLCFSFTLKVFFLCYHNKNRINILVRKNFGFINFSFYLGYVSLILKKPKNNTNFLHQFLQLLIVCLLIYFYFGFYFYSDPIYH